MHTLEVMTRAFREALKDLRLALGLSQFQVAVILDMSPTQVSRWENGTSEPHKLMQDAVLQKLRAEEKKRRKPTP